MRDEMLKIFSIIFAGLKSPKMNDKQNAFLKGLNMRQNTAYCQLYDEYYKPLVLYSKNFVLTNEVAEDIVQELFSVIWEKKMTFLSFPAFRIYLYNSVRNASLNYLKHQNIESIYIQQVTDAYQEITEDDVNEEEVYRLLFRTIDRLPARCREVFLLHMEGKKNQEIAEVLGIAIGTVKTQKKRAMQFLKEQMGTLFFLLPLMKF